MAAPTEVYQWLGPKSGTRKWRSHFANHSRNFTGIKKCKTWPGFSTPVAFEAHCFEREQDIGNIKHALGAQMIRLSSPRHFAHAFHNFYRSWKVRKLASVFDFKALYCQNTETNLKQIREAPMTGIWSLQFSPLFLLHRSKKSEKICFIFPLQSSMSRLVSEGGTKWNWQRTWERRCPLQIWCSLFHPTPKNKGSLRTFWKRAG